VVANAPLISNSDIGSNNSQGKYLFVQAFLALVCMVRTGCKGYLNRDYFLKIW
jgi:hypothetical protein